MTFFSLSTCFIQAKIGINSKYECKEQSQSWICADNGRL